MCIWYKLIFFHTFFSLSLIGLLVFSLWFLFCFVSDFLNSEMCPILFPVHSTNFKLKEEIKLSPILLKKMTDKSTI